MTDIIKAVINGLLSLFDYILLRKIILLVIAFIFIDFIFGHCSRGDKEVKTKTDTIRIVKDTKTSHAESVRLDESSYQIPKMAFITVPAERETLYVTKIDTFLVREQKQYEDSTYKAWVSGIDARLDSIKTYTKYVTLKDTTWITIETTLKPKKKAKKWEFGLQVGYGITPEGFQPYAGGGFKVNF